jgi:hypothetical protein
MPRISSAKEEKIKEGLLQLLFQNSPKALFTAQLSQESARDEEFIKAIMLRMEHEGLVVSVKKSPQGKVYSRRIRWLLAPKVYDAYRKLSEPVQDTRLLLP